ncbi:hypothetical protein AYI69_g58 [Smittium culicis]|uniref:Uncharacterized protein n=1 Tax=Smittium culicis TaxID=133412 RepID=A0A1R1YU24_9FUNG|nr:hypothetical protein AYI69_g58 [Smittium culicis]
MDLSNFSSFFEKSKSWFNFGRKSPVKTDGSLNNLIYTNNPEASRQKHIYKPPYSDSEYSQDLNYGCFGFLKLKPSNQNDMNKIDSASIASCSKYNSKQRYPNNKDFIYYPTEYSKFYSKRDQTTNNLHKHPSITINHIHNPYLLNKSDETENSHNGQFNCKFNPAKVNGLCNILANKYTCVKRLLKPEDTTSQSLSRETLNEFNVSKQSYSKFQNTSDNFEHKSSLKGTHNEKNNSDRSKSIFSSILPYRKLHFQFIKICSLNTRKSRCDSMIDPSEYNDCKKRKNFYSIPKKKSIGSYPLKLKDRSLKIHKDENNIISKKPNSDSVASISSYYSIRDVINFEQPCAKITLNLVRTRYGLAKEKVSGFITQAKTHPKPY